MASPFDPYKFIGLTLNPDGSVTRYNQPATISAAPKLISDTQIALSKDISLNPSKLTFIRLHRPVSPPPATQNKLPIIIYFHGGFVAISVSTDFIHNSLTLISGLLSVIIISVEYRLTPENRLPTPYDDGLDSIKWVRNQALSVVGREEWLENADFSKVYLMGTSAGGNIAYFACLISLDLDLLPIKIKGVIMDEPFFGSVERTKSELEYGGDDQVLPLKVTDLIWSLSLPEGADRDSKYSNPNGEEHKSLYGRIKGLPKCMIRTRGMDPLVDKQQEVAKLLESLDVEVIKRFYPEGTHGIEIYNPTTPFGKTLRDDVSDFISN